MIVEKENVKIGQNAIEKLIEGSCHGIFISTEHILVSAGDMRRSITYLQSLHRLNAEEISPADVLDVAAMCDDDRVRSIIQAAHQISFDKLIQKVKDLLLVSKLLNLDKNLFIMIFLGRLPSVSIFGAITGSNSEQ